MNATLVAALCAIAITACVEGSAPIDRCGPRPAPQDQMFVHQTVIGSTSSISIDTETWHRHEAWLGDMVAWADCMTE